VGPLPFSKAFHSKNRFTGRKFRRRIGAARNSVWPFTLKVIEFVKGITMATNMPPRLGGGDQADIQGNA
jgi:hypothetical protein